MAERRDDSAEFDEAIPGARDGAGSDEPIDPAMAPVIEAGGGVAEGFEQAEAALVENAEEGRPDATDVIEEDAGAPESEPDRGVYGDADHERTAGDGEG